MSSRVEHASPPSGSGHFSRRDCVGQFGTGPVGRSPERLVVVRPLWRAGRLDQARHAGPKAAVGVFGGRPTTSRAGAMGLMQLMPRTWRDMRVGHALGADPHDPRDNILAGAACLRSMYDRFGCPGLFAACNAGRRYADHLATGRRLPAETAAYVVAVSGARAARGPPFGHAG